MKRALLLTLVGALAGCGGPSHMRVWGEVALNGQPVQEGTIEFTPIDGTPGPSTGGNIKQGQYEVPAHVGPLADGTYAVAIRSMVKSGKTGPHPLNPGERVELLENIIPPAYHRQTTLKVHISDRAAENQHDFRLTK